LLLTLLLLGIFGLGLLSSNALVFGKQIAIRRFRAYMMLAVFSVLIIILVNVIYAFSVPGKIVFLFGFIVAVWLPAIVQIFFLLSPLWAIKNSPQSFELWKNLCVLLVCIVCIFGSAYIPVRATNNGFYTKTFNPDATDYILSRQNVVGLDVATKEFQLEFLFHETKQHQTSCSRFIRDKLAIDKNSSSTTIFTIFWIDRVIMSIGDIHRIAGCRIVNLEPKRDATVIWYTTVFYDNFLKFLWFSILASLLHSTYVRLVYLFKKV